MVYRLFYMNKEIVLDSKVGIEMKLAIDAMGGDHAPVEVCKGVEQAVTAFPDTEFILYGDETEIRKILPTAHERITIVHTDEVIHSDEDPIKAYRQKKNASMVLALAAVKNGEADACISAGSTGAYLTAGLFVVGRIKGITRPALAPTFPTANGKGFVLLDAGANAEAKPEYLLQFGVMGAIYAEKVRGIRNPTVGLLNIGTEENKGNELTKAAFALLRDSHLNFVGNVEARDLLSGVADVVVADGFSGNMVLKATEGAAGTILGMLKTGFMSSTMTKFAALLMRSELKKIKDAMDYNEQGGAALFGVKAPVIKAHGSSKAHAFYNAIRQARLMVESQFATEIERAITEEEM